MPKIDLNKNALSLSKSDIEKFDADGFFFRESVLEEAAQEALKREFSALFSGQFSKNTYPDEWYWREEISKPTATRHISNSWKSSHLIEELACYPEFGAIAKQLGRWEGARLAMDTIWWKTAKGSPISFHQDTSFMDCFTPKVTITIWITLTPTDIEVGTLEYVKGSHKWSHTKPPDQFHAPSDYRSEMWKAAELAGIDKCDIEIVPVELPAGSISIHSGEIWHGSGNNITVDRERMAIGLHFLPSTITFNNDGAGYIFRRYQVNKSVHVENCFFPIVA